jgi:hypothetical protein
MSWWLGRRGSHPTMSRCYHSGRDRVGQGFPRGVHHHWALEPRLHFAQTGFPLELNYPQYYPADVAPDDCTLTKAAPAWCYYLVLSRLKARRNKAHCLYNPQMDCVVSRLHVQKPPRSVIRRRARCANASLPTPGRHPFVEASSLARARRTVSANVRHSALGR